MSTYTGTDDAGAPHTGRTDQPPADFTAARYGDGWTALAVFEPVTGRIVGRIATEWQHGRAHRLWWAERTREGVTA